MIYLKHFNPFSVPNTSQLRTLCIPKVHRLKFYSDGIQNPKTFFSNPTNTPSFQKDMRNVLKTLPNAYRGHKDLAIFISYLSRPYTCLPLLKNIDTQLSSHFSQHAAIFSQQATPNTRRAHNEIRYAFAQLSRHYGFNDTLFETVDRLLSEDTFSIIPKLNCLVLDMGERGHGPIVHSIASCLLKEMEKISIISSARETHALLAESSHIQNEYFTGFVPIYKFVLDNPETKTLTNPASFANFLIELSEALPTISTLVSFCQTHAEILSRQSQSDFKNFAKNAPDWRHPNDDSTGGNYMHYSSSTIIDQVEKISNSR